MTRSLLERKILIGGLVRVVSESRARSGGNVIRTQGGGEHWGLGERGLEDCAEACGSLRVYFTRKGSGDRRVAYVNVHRQ